MIYGKEYQFFKGYLENCNAELMDEIVDHFLVGANRTIIVVLCI